MGPDGGVPTLAVGEAAALVRGQEVDVSVEKVEEMVVISLPNDVAVAFGRSTSASEATPVAADGSLRMYRDDEVDVVVTGLVPGTIYTVYLFSEPLEVGRGVADANGEVRTSVSIPGDIEFGDHTLQVNGVGPGGEIVTTSMGMQVLERENNSTVLVLSLAAAVLLAMLGGRPIFTKRRRRRLV